MKVTDQEIIDAAACLARTSDVVTGGQIARRLGVTPRAINWRIRRLEQSKGWPFPRDVRAGHPSYGSGWQRTTA